MEALYSTEDKAEADRLVAQLKADGINGTIVQTGTWYEVQVATADAVQGMRTLSHFFKG